VGENAFLDFRIPYTDKEGKQRRYLPDFLVHCRLAGRSAAMVIIEVTGFSADKAEKKWTVEHRWLPAVNAVREQHGWLHWSFLELDGEEAVADLRNLLLKNLAE
jgi:type III restriction enzyme